MRVFRPLHAILLLIAAAAIAGPAWAVFLYKPEPFSDWWADMAPMPKRQITYLQRMADRSCKCAQAKSSNADKDQCWHRFDAMTDDLRTRGGYAGMFFAEQYITIKDTEDVIELGSDLNDYNVHGSHLENAFCSEAEVRAAKAIEVRLDACIVVTADPERIDLERAAVNTRVYRALHRFSRRLGTGESIASAASAETCASVFGVRGPGQP